MQEQRSIEDAFKKELDQALASLSLAICENTLVAQNPLICPTVRAKAILEQLKRDVTTMCKQASDGLMHIRQALAETAISDGDLDIEAMNEDLQQGFSKFDSLDTTLEYAARVQQQVSWSELLGLRERTLFTLYIGAKVLFEKKWYKEAEDAFTFLVNLDSAQSCFWMGLGHAQFQLGKFDEAMMGYAASAKCDPASIWPHIFTANCLEAVREYTKALLELETALRLLVENPERDRELEGSLKERIVFLKINP